MNIFLVKTGTYDECEWTDWLDQDDPSGYGDYEPVPDGCNVQKYQVQDAEWGGAIYNDVYDMSQCLIDSPYVACINDHQGWDCWKGNLPTYQENCSDYQVRYCCGKPKPKCYCCAPRLPVNECEDNGCEKHFYGLGKCIDVTNADLQQLNDKFDISKTAEKGDAWSWSNNSLCGATVDHSCCRCMKMKTCKDNGCKDKFGGQGNHPH